MKALVTGGGGFLGGAIVKKLLRKEFVVRTFSRGNYPFLKEWGVEALQGDLAQYHAVERACAGCDIIFHAPKPGSDGKAVPGSFTVLHNGVLVQDHIPVGGEPTTAAKLQGLASKGPLVLQDHGNPVRYRNIWLRRL